MADNQIEKGRTEGGYPPAPGRVQKREIDPTLFPRSAGTSLAQRIFDFIERLFGVIGKLLLALLIVTLEIWIYPDGFFDTPFASMTLKSLLGFLFSIGLWIFAVGILISIFS